MDIQDKLQRLYAEEARKLAAYREALPTTQRERDEAWGLAEELLGRPGKMLSGSKQAPIEQRVVWNGNVVTREHGKIWFGDISLAQAEHDLRELAGLLEVPVYVLYERDCRFDREYDPRFSEAVEVFHP